MSYRSRPTRGRRTKEDILSLEMALLEIVLSAPPMTVRQVFYQAVTRGLVDKTEAEYKSTVIRLLTKMRKRRGGPASTTVWLDPNLIADNTRWMRKPTSYSSVEEMLRETAQLYRRDLWRTQDTYVEIWLEKEALAGVLYDVTGEWDVPLMVTRGYPSFTFVSGAAQAINEIGKPVSVYYFGDHDPSGVDIARHTEERLSELAPDAEIDFEVVAVTPDLIEELDLPTRPTKEADTRSARFRGESVEVDAIPPEILRNLARSCIEQHIDEDALQVTRMVEESEREVLERIAETAGAV